MLLCCSLDPIGDDNHLFPPVQAYQPNSHVSGGFQSEDGVVTPGRVHKEVGSVANPHQKMLHLSHKLDSFQILVDQDTGLYTDSLQSLFFGRRQ